LSVPKCKECEYHWKYDVRWKGGKTRSGRGTHWCKHPKVLHTVPYSKALESEYITSAEFKTSPKWCPKRLEVNNG
jgi:hypothetical protein